MFGFNKNYRPAFRDKIIAIVGRETNYLDKLLRYIVQRLIFKFLFHAHMWGKICAWNKNLKIKIGICNAYYRQPNCMLTMLSNSFIHSTKENL